ncbi:MAG TPA: EVE domain-containing protein [Burkholderiales bacterium]|nr:EVE domain-containing protein [Burkholderiales bacterium]
MNYWLFKSEPSTYGIDHLAADKVTAWTGVRNYQARNFMRDSMRVGDGVLFYHSSCPEPGVAGLAEVASAAYPDPTQFQSRSPYFDPKSTRAAPRWMMVDVRALRRIPLVPLAEIRRHKALARMWLLRPGSRLSITPVAPDEWRFITEELA